MLTQFNRDERKRLNLEKVAFVLSERPSFRVGMIAHVIGVSERTCYRYLAELKESAVIVHEGKGRYVCATQIRSQKVLLQDRSELSCATPVCS